MKNYTADFIKVSLRIYLWIYLRSHLRAHLRIQLRTCFRIYLKVYLSISFADCVQVMEHFIRLPGSPMIELRGRRIRSSRCSLRWPARVPEMMSFNQRELIPSSDNGIQYESYSVSISECQKRGLVLVFNTNHRIASRHILSLLFRRLEAHASHVEPYHVLAAS